ncbi:MAG TPA: hypothetical protein VFZ31_01525 [Vicinamibacterales bacterium]
MAAPQGGLTASIRRKLQDGKTPEEIIQELVAGGMGQVSAQRFVDRALAENTSLPQPDSQPAAPTSARTEGDALDSFIQTKTVETQAAEAKSGSKTLWYACGLMCLGIGITAFSYSIAGPGQRYTVMWGPVAVGVFLWGKAVFGGLAHARSFSWTSAIVSLAVPAVMAVALRAYVAPTPAVVQSPQASFIQLEKGPDGKYRRVESRPDSNPGVARLLAEFEEAESLTARCDAVDRIARVSSQEAATAVDGLMEHYESETNRVQYCIRNAVRRLDPSVEFEEDAR